jgi:hypothetical protein
MATDAGSGLPGNVLDAYIRVQRQLADLSLRHLAGLSNVSNACLSQIERGLGPAGAEGAAFHRDRSEPLGRDAAPSMVSLILSR